MSRLHTSAIATRTWTVIAILCCAATLPTPCIAQRGGLTAGLGDRFDPTGDRRPEQYPSDEPKTPGQLVGLPPDNRWDDRVRELEATKPADVPPVDDLQTARTTIDRLSSAVDEARGQFDARSQSSEEAIAGRIAQVRDKWSEVTDAMHDGERRSRLDWHRLTDSTFERSAGSLRHRTDVDTIGDAANEELGLPTSTRPSETDGGDSLDEEPVEPRDTDGKDLLELAKDFKDQSKPASMPTSDWLKLQDEFDRDIADLQEDIGRERRRTRRAREAELAPLEEALDEARRTHDELARLEEGNGDLNDAFRQHMARRLHAAELEEARLQRDRSRQLANERNTGSSERLPDVVSYPRDPFRTVDQIARLIALSGRPGAPAAEQFDGITPDGLGNLYPDSGVDDDGVHYGNLIRSNIDRHRRTLSDIAREHENAGTWVDEEDQLEITLEMADMRRAGASVEERRQRRREMRQRQRAQRDRRIADRRTELDERAESVIRRADADIKRLEALD